MESSALWGWFPCECKLGAGKSSTYKGSAAEVAGAAGLTAAQVEAVYSNIDSKRNATRYLHLKPLLADVIGEIP
jgi:hypothetical protein